MNKFCLILSLFFCYFLSCNQSPTKKIMNTTDVISISGTALNAKAGAVVSVDSTSYYIDELSAWPDELLGKKVQVKGELITIDHSGQSMKDENGRWLQKMRGTQRIIKKAKWEVLP
jgi:hypothetical protein